MRTYLVAFVATVAVSSQVPRDWRLEITQLTRGPMHHFFGYIGQARTIPWNRDGRHVVALRTSFQDRMPKPGEPADVVLIDTTRGNQVEAVDQSRGWNPQQGTMFYWNPEAPATQVFFNDRDPQTEKIFTVLFDVATRKRVREYRFPETPVANSGVAQNGGRFLAINYGRLARLRPVTGYPGAHDFTGATLHPTDDGIHLIDVASSTRRLLVSYKQLADLVRPVRPDVDRKALFINHTLWSRDDSHIYFYVRAEFDNRTERIDIPCTIRPDGTGLTMHPHTGGHPEWESGRRVIGADGQRQVIYDVIDRRIVDTLGTPEIFPQPGETLRCHRTVSGSSTGIATRVTTSTPCCDDRIALGSARPRFRVGLTPAGICALTARRHGIVAVMQFCFRASIRMMGRGSYLSFGCGGDALRRQTRGSAH